MNRDTVETKAKTVSTPQKRRSVAIVLAFFLGAFGTHWFYLGRGDKGKWYLLFCWTFIPTLLGIRDVVRFYRANERQFDEILGAAASVPPSEFPWSERHWIRLKRFVLTFVGTFALAVIVIGVRVPENVDGATPAYPLAYLLTMVFAVLIMVSPFVVSYFISKDQHELGEYFDDISSRRWITVLLFSAVSFGLYPLWYMFMRRRRVSSVANFFAEGEFEVESDDRPPDVPASAANGRQEETSPDRGGQPAAPFRKSFRAAIEEGDENRADTREQLEAGDYDDAERALKRAKTAYESALETARTTDGIDEAEASNRLDSLGELNMELRRSRLADELDAIESALNDVNRRGTERGTEVERLAERLERVAEEIDGNEIDALSERVSDLKSRLKDTRDQRRQTRRGPPSSVSDAPTVAVAYDTLEDREPIGGGGNADVTKATLPTEDGSVTVAVKTPRLSGTLHTDTVERLMDEARTWQQLDDHEHIVGVLDYGSEPLPWIAMEYMDAGHLGDRAGELPIEQAYWTALSITRAVRYAHRHGVAHLDLKPANVLFTTAEDAWDVPKVADWGLSKQLLDHSKSVEGLSPHYAAPEQFDSDYVPVDDVTDVYQLGAVLYELFTGKPPFDGEPAKVMRSVLDEAPDPPTTVDPSLPPAVDDIVMPTLAKEKADRYDSVIYIRDALEEQFGTVH